MADHANGAAPLAAFRTIFPLSISAALSETPGWLAPPLVGLTLIAHGHTATTAGLISSLPAAGIITMSALLPTLARWAGVVRLFYAAVALLAASLLLLIAASQSYALWMWCAGSYGVGLAASIRWVLSDGFVNHLAISGQRGRLLAFHETIRSCALGLGPLIAAATTTVPATGFAVALVLVLAGAVLTLGMQLPEVPTGRARWRDLSAGLKIAPAAFTVAFFGGVLEGAAAATIPLYAVTMGLSAATGALLAAVSGFGNIIGQLPFGAFADRAGAKPAIRAALIVTALALAALHAAIAVPHFAGFVMLAFGAAAGALYTLAVMEAARAGAGSVGILQTLAAIAVLYTLGDLAGPILGGFLLDLAPAYVLPLVLLGACLVTARINDRGIASRALS